ncbi:putative phage tail component, N-terminal domain-containing protein [Clostridium grantii DSM 8605]|uniref:Putative phage tail component, N-terminal domain-containing protein n=1 Tax=Clostridium grantii DSM 8605 TaxID=1121316 RepID=A0A1M5U914_9CLOT|nr:putative phage tail component, N-terminal domain-containing protein [Clostridium grantii DSM 8605]
MLDKIDEIKAWLINAEESDLIFSFQPDKRYIGQVVNSIDFKQVFKFTSSFPIVFNCRPFKYSTEDEVITITQIGSIIYNEGTFKSEPIIKIFGSGDITISINNEEIIIKNVEEYVTIDSVLKDCYKDEVLKNADMVGDFPILEIGDNVISFSGNVNKVEVQVNEVWI